MRSSRRSRRTSNVRQQWHPQRKQTGNDKQQMRPQPRQTGNDKQHSRAQPKPNGRRPSRRTLRQALESVASG